MPKCLNCNNERKGCSAYCGDTCRVVWNRNKKRNTGALIKSVTPVTDNKGVTGFTDLPNTETIPPVEQVRYKLPDVVVTKRGKDIKCFADLPPHVQQTIKKMSSDDGGVTWDKAEKDRRTAIAINYQHVTEPTGNPEIYDYDPEYRRPT